LIPNDNCGLSSSPLDSPEPDIGTFRINLGVGLLSSSSSSPCIDPSSSMTAPTILTRPISAFAIPAEILSNFSVRLIQASPSATPSAIEAKSTAAPNSGSAINCQTCPGAAFDSIEEQREHFKRDWHRYNVKAKLTGRAVSEEEWGNLVEGERGVY